MAVWAHLIRVDRLSSGVPLFIGLTAISSSRLMARLTDSLKARTINCGCTVSSMNRFIIVMNSQARRVTEVVPSPISASWDLAMSTRVFAAGWTMSRSWRIVAPSLEM